MWQVEETKGGESMAYGVILLLRNDPEKEW